jgi:hypothetical protein
LKTSSNEEIEELHNENLKYKEHLLIMSCQSRVEALMIFGHWMRGEANN